MIVNKVKKPLITVLGLGNKAKDMAVDSVNAQLLKKSLKKGKNEFFERVATMTDATLLDYFKAKFESINSCAIYNPSQVRSEVFAFARQNNDVAIDRYLERVRNYRRNSIDGFNSFSILTGYADNTKDMLWNEPDFRWFETAEGYEWFVKYVQ